MKRIHLFLAFCLLLIAAPAGAQVLLAFNLQQGKIYSYSSDFDINQNYQDQKIQMKITGVYDLEVTGMEGNDRLVRSTYRRMAIKMVLPSVTLEGDSDQPLPTEFSPENIMSYTVQALVGKSFTMRVSPEGEIRAVLGIKEMSDAAIADIKVPEEYLASIRQSFGQQFNETSIKESFAQAFNIYPNRVVKPGDSWKRDFRGVSNPVTVKSTYTVKAIKGDLVMVDVSSDLEMTGQISMTGTQTGSIVLEAATGLTRNGELRQTLSGDMTMTTVCTFSGRIK